MNHSNWEDDLDGVEESPFAFMPPDASSDASSSHNDDGVGEGDGDGEGRAKPKQPRFRPGSSRPATAMTDDPFVFFSSTTMTSAPGTPQQYATPSRPRTSRGTPPASASGTPFASWATTADMRPSTSSSANPWIARTDRLSTSTGPGPRPLTSFSRPESRARDEVPAPPLPRPRSISASKLRPLVPLNTNGRSTAEEEMRTQMIREEAEEESDEEDLGDVFAFMRPPTLIEPEASPGSASGEGEEQPTADYGPDNPEEAEDLAESTVTPRNSHEAEQAPVAETSTPTRSQMVIPPFMLAAGHPDYRPAMYSQPESSAMRRRAPEPSPSGSMGMLPGMYGGAYHKRFDFDSADPSSSSQTVPDQLDVKRTPYNSLFSHFADPMVPSPDTSPGEAYPMSSLGYAHQHEASLPESRSSPGPAGPTGPRPRDFMYDSRAVHRRKPQVVVVEDNDTEDSPYIEVRCAVQSDDDMSELCNTLRVWVIAFIIITAMSAANCYWTFRSPSPTFTTPIVVLCSWPIGRAWAMYMPEWSIPLPKCVFGAGAKLEVNPGPWTMKEHALITQMGTVTTNNYLNYPIYMLTAIDSREFWDHPTGGRFIHGLLVAWSASIYGIALAGLFQRFLIQAPSTVWPHNLSISLLINILHAEEDPPPGEVGRLRFFRFLLNGTFIWQWVPTYLFTGLSKFNWPCWIAPNSAVVNYMFGYTNGLALLPLTLDWAQVSTFSSPLIPPWWTSLNLGISYAFFWIFLGTLLYFTNALNFGYLPIYGAGLFDRWGDKYDVNLILDHPHGKLQESRYAEYSRPFFSYGFYLIFYAGLAMPVALIVHFFLHYHSSIRHTLKFGKPEKDDVHAKLMSRYPQVPMWVYMALVPISFGVAVGMIYGSDTGMPIWSILVAYLLISVFFLPAGIIFAQTNLFMTFTNILADLVGGYMHPGSAVVNILFKSFCITANDVGILFASAMKIGHYLKVPPRVTFVAQILALLWAYVVQFAVKLFFQSHVADLCSPTQRNNMVCPGAQQTYYSSVAWGTIGPQRIFGQSGIYKSVYWSFLVGGVVPIPIWLLNKRYKVAQFVSAPILFLGATFIPSFTPVAVMVYMIPNLFTQWYMRRKHFKFWDQYQYIASAALDTGTTLASMLIFLVLQLPKDGTIQLHWRGNDIFKQNRDYQATSWLPIPQSGLSW